MYFLLTNDRFREGFYKAPKTPKTGLFSFSKLTLDCEFSICYSVASFDNFRETDKLCKLAMLEVSTQDQDLSLQHAALEEALCDKIYNDKASGANASRDGLTLALDILRENDSLVVWKLDRLGRSVKDLVAIVNDLAQRGVHFKCLTDKIDTSTPSGRFFFHVMASLAQMERDLTIERTRAGLEAARRQGRTGGRKRKMTDTKISAAKQLLREGISPPEVAQNLGVSIPTLYRWLPASQQLET